MPATIPARSESLPSVADTVWVDSGVSCTGSDPYRSTVARSLASRWENWPVMVALLSKFWINVGWMVGADCTTPSSTMASAPVDPPGWDGQLGSLATHLAARSLNLPPPSPLNDTDTVQSPPAVMSGGTAVAVLTTEPN